MRLGSLSSGLCIAALFWTACDLNRDAPGGYTTASGSGGSTANLNPTVGSGGDSSLGGGLDAIEDPEGPCDADVTVDTLDPVQAAAAVGICKQSTGTDDWGLIEARWALPDGTDFSTDYEDAYHLGHGVLPAFGAELVPLEGDKVLALSSGTARQPSDPDYIDVSGFAKGYTAGVPNGVSQLSPSCPSDTFTGQPNDAVALEVVMRPPAEAKGLAFDFDFYTFEWPMWVCTEFNDYFVALLDPPPTAGEPNISFDADGNLVTVNNALVTHCDCDGGPPCQAGMAMDITYQCENGADRLVDTGFYGEVDGGGFSRAATGWLTTQAPIAVGEDVTLRFALWDSGDGVLDSTTIVDNFRWLGEAEDDPETTPIPK